MKNKKNLILIISLSFLTLSIQAGEVSPTMKNISKFNEDRIIFHFANFIDQDGNRIGNSSSNLDPSLASLVVIRDSQTYIFRDGYDDRSEVSARLKEYQKQVSNYRSRRAFLKEFRDIVDEREKLSKVADDFKRRKDNSKYHLHSLYLKYDSIYKTIALEKKKAVAEEYRQKKFSGENSPRHITAIENLDSISKEQDARAEFLEKALTEEMNAKENKTEGSQSASKQAVGQAEGLEEAESKKENSARVETALSPAANPGEINTRNFYTQVADGIVDYFSYSRNARTIDLEKKDTETAKTVSEKYSNLYNTMVERLISAHLKKLKYLYSRKNETGSKTVTELNPAGNGKRIILVSNDNTRYSVEDWDGDGITETFEVSNQSYNMQYASDSANIIGMYNCNKVKPCDLIQSLASDLENGIGIELSSVQTLGADNVILGSEDELLKDWEELLKK
ncbi:MAG: hypothetical protein GW938_04710 [Leptospira sp.]|nr:hypothetical protein [Leptospira sp.]NCS95180.1 hypothetical protein [Leptospira sp.]